MSDVTPRRGGRSSWLVLALVALIAIVALALYMNRSGRDGVVVSNTTADGSSSVEAAADENAERATREAAEDTGGALGGAGESLTEGARDVAGAAGSAAERAAEVTAEGARDAAQATESAVERATDGDPDSDGNEAR